MNYDPFLGEDPMPFSQHLDRVQVVGRRFSNSLHRFVRGIATAGDVQFAATRNKGLALAVSLKSQGDIADCDRWHFEVDLSWHHMTNRIK